MTETKGAGVVLARLEALEELVQSQGTKLDEQAARIASLEAETAHLSTRQTARPVVADPMAPLTTGRLRRSSDSG